MKKKWTVIVATAAITTAIVSATSFAAPALKLFINGNEYATDYLKLKVENGTVMVSLRDVVDLFKGQLSVDHNNVRITLPNATNLANQVKQLESSYEAHTPEEAVQTWLKGVQDRNGALQYAVLSPALRAKTLKEFNEHFWVTGGSSPHMGKVQLPAPVKLSNDTVQFTFDYPLVIMEKPFGTGKAQITVQKVNSEGDEHWVITKIKLKEPYDTGVMIGAEQL